MFIMLINNMINVSERRELQFNQINNALLNIRTLQIILRVGTQ